MSLKYAGHQATSAVENRQRNFERYALGYRQPVECVPECRHDVFVMADASDQSRSRIEDRL